MKDANVEFFGIALAVIVGVVVAVILLAGLYGAACLHWATRFLKFKRATFRKAFLTNLMLMAIPAFTAGGSWFLNEKYAHLNATIFMVGSMLNFGTSVIAIKTMYDAPVGRSVAAYLMGSVFAGLFALGLFLLILAILFVLIQTGVVPTSTQR